MIHPIPEPKTVNEAMCNKEREGWIAAMGNELHSVLKILVYDLVEPREMCHLMGNKWDARQAEVTTGGVGIHIARER